MTDVHEPEIRSYNMSRIRDKNTKPELIVRKFLFSKGFRYRLHDPTLPGKPDIVLAKRKTLVFIHGCFWHGHEGCRYFVIPDTRRDWWIEKIAKNKANDEKNKQKLTENGWKIFIIWECELKFNKRDITLNQLASDLKCESLY